MKNSKGLLLLGLPGLGLLLVAGTLVMRRSPGEVAVPDARLKTTRKSSPSSDGPLVASPAGKQAARIAAPPDTIERAMDDARLRTTYQNFLIALSTGNTQAQSALRTVLLPDRDEVIRLAQTDADRAASESDRSTALKAIESLRR